MGSRSGFCSPACTARNPQQRRIRTFAGRRNCWSVERHGAIASRQSWSIDLYDGRRARCVTCDTLKARPTGIDGDKRLMSLIPEEGIRAMCDEFTDLALDDAHVDAAGQSLAGLV